MENFEEDDENISNDFLSYRDDYDDEFDFSEFQQSYKRFKMPGSQVNNTKVCFFYLKISETFS